MNVSITGVLVLAGVLLILAGIAGLLALIAAPGVPLIIFGFIVLLVAAFVGRGGNL